MAYHRCLAYQRSGANLVEVDYQVKDVDSATVTTALLAVRDGNAWNRTGYSVPMRTFGDAYINSDEFARGLHPGVHSLPDHGGISRWRSILSVIQDPNHYVLLTELSQPAGMVNQTRIVPKGVAVSLTNPPGSTAGYFFTGWLLNGTRFDRPADLQPISVTPTGDMILVARYIQESADTDGDLLLDWKEWLWFESLQYNNASDPDGDGSTIADEQQRGFSSLAPDVLAHGGLSRRRAASIYVDFTGQLPFRQASDPATILDLLTYHPTGSRVTVPSKEGHTSGGYQFTWWDLNGTRQQDASGAALPGFGFTLDIPSTATAHYIDPSSTRMAMASRTGMSGPITEPWPTTRPATPVPMVSRMRMNSPAINLLGRSMY